MGALVALARSLLLVAAILIAGFGRDGAQAADAVAPVELKVSVAVGPALPLGRAAEHWAALLAESADKRFTTKLHPGASLAGRDAAREFAALQDGTADLAVGSALQWSMQVPALAIFCLPWIAPDNRALETLAANVPLRDALATRLDARGVVVVAIAPLGYRELATTTRAIRTPADLNGLRLRASPSPLVHDLLLTLGALPQAMSFTQAQAAFASGTLDGQEGPPSALAAARAALGGIRHLTDWGAIADAMVFAVRKAVWTAWSEAERIAALKAAERAIAAAMALSREDAAVRQIGAHGVAVVRITPAGHDAFRAAARNVIARWREAVGGDVVALAESALRAQPLPAGKGS